MPRVPDKLKSPIRFETKEVNFIGKLVVLRRVLILSEKLFLYFTYRNIVGNNKNSSFQSYRKELFSY